MIKSRGLCESNTQMSTNHHRKYQDSVSEDGIPLGTDNLGLISFDLLQIPDQLLASSSSAANQNVRVIVNFPYWTSYMADHSVFLSSNMADSQPSWPGYEAKESPKLDKEFYGLVTKVLLKKHSKGASRGASAQRPAPQHPALEVEPMMFIVLNRHRFHRP